MGTDVEQVDAFLAHYGKKGMRWGIVNEDEPVGDSGKPEKEAFKERRALKRDNEVKTTQARIDGLKAKPFRSKRDEKSKNAQIADLEKYRDRQKDDAQRIREGKLTSKGKKLVIGASVAAGILAAYGAYKYVDSGEMNQLIIKGKEFATGQQHSWKKNDFLSQSMDVDGIMKNVVSKVNPGYGTPGTKVNCRRCTFAYEMRRRGFDVKATKTNTGAGQTAAGLLNAIDPESNLKTGKLGIIYEITKEMQSESGTGPLKTALEHSNWGANKINLDEYLKDIKVPQSGNVIEQLFGPDPKLFAPPKAQAILDALKTHPDGARGELGVGWLMGGGHSVAWEIIGGKPVIFDNQSGKKYESIEDLIEFAGNVSEAGVTRLDNIPLNDNFLRRWLQDA